MSDRLTREQVEHFLNCGHWNSPYEIDLREKLRDHDATLTAENEAFKRDDVLRKEECERLSRSVTQLTAEVERLQHRNMEIHTSLSIATERIIALTAENEQLKAGFNLQHFVDIATAPLKQAIQEKDADLQRVTGERDEWKGHHDNIVRLKREGAERMETHFKEQISLLTAEINVLKMSQRLAGVIADTTKDAYIEERSDMLHGDGEAAWFAQATKESINEELCCALLNWSFCQDRLKDTQAQLTQAQERETRLKDPHSPDSQAVIERWLIAFAQGEAKPGDCQGILQRFIDEAVRPVEERERTLREALKEIPAYILETLPWTPNVKVGTGDGRREYNAPWLKQLMELAKAHAALQAPAPPRVAPTPPPGL